MTSSIRKLLLLSLLAFCGSVIGAEVLNEAREFDRYPVAVRLGSTALPSWASRDSKGQWRDANGKVIPTPEVNFAGKYFVAVHSCGASCRYYSATDLSTGVDHDFLDMFASTDPPPMTKEGYRYITDLEVRKNSALIIATYVIATPRGPRCRVKMFSLTALSILPVSGTKNMSCTRQASAS